MTKKSLSLDSFSVCEISKIPTTIPSPGLSMIQNSSSAEKWSVSCEAVLEASDPQDDVVIVISLVGEVGAGSFKADCGGSMSSIAAPTILAGKKNTSVGPLPLSDSSEAKQHLSKISKLKEISITSGFGSSTDSVCMKRL